jgi:hypothetical protein
MASIGAAARAEQRPAVVFDRSDAIRGTNESGRIQQDAAAITGRNSIGTQRPG